MGSESAENKTNTQQRRYGFLLFDLFKSDSYLIRSTCEVTELIINIAIYFTLFFLVDWGDLTA